MEAIVWENSIVNEYPITLQWQFSHACTTENYPDGSGGCMGTFEKFNLYRNYKSTF